MRTTDQITCPAFMAGHGTAVRSGGRCLRWVGALLLTGGLVNSAFAAEKPAEDPPLVPALKLARQSHEAAKDVEDYQALFTKKERKNGQLHKQRMLLKHRSEPFSVYLRFYKPHNGREVIYVEGKYDGKLLAHETGIKGLAGTVALAPDSPEVMKHSRHPITRIGMARLAEGVIRQWEQERNSREVEVTYYNQARLGEMDCLVIETKHPRPRKDSPFSMTRLYIDKETKLPVRLEQYGFPRRSGGRPPLVEEYTYSNIRADVDLKDIDFSPRNPEYGFD